MTDNRAIRSILFFLAGDENTASTRIRFFSMLPWLEKQNIHWSTDLSVKQVLNSDFLFIQKRLDDRILKFARLAKLLGKPIVYDIDDFGYALKYYASQVPLRKMLELTELITVGSESQKAIVESEFHRQNIQVFPPLIDYYPQAPLQSPDLADDPLRVLWFGLAYNLAPLEQLVEKVSLLPSVKLVVITEGKSIPKLRAKFPYIEFHSWSLSTFVQTLRTCHLSVLSHDGSDYDQAKTNNKMIASINWGVPALVSDTPEYHATAIKMGVSDCVFTNADELVHLIEHYRSRPDRETYLQTAQPIIWRLHSPETVTQYFLDFCGQIRVEGFFTRLVHVFQSIA